MGDVSKKNIVVLTGAGISAESGLETFRGQGGLWGTHRVEDVACFDAFVRNPDFVHDFYNFRRRQLCGVKPNKGHYALAELEEKHSGDFTLITQNIDDLHEKAGSDNILHMHGELFKIRCQKTKKVFHEKGDIHSQSTCPCCQEKGNLRPHVVWFGEIPIGMGLIEKSLLNCDLFLAIGTSGRVYPAASFVELVKREGGWTIEVNLMDTDVSEVFHERIFGKATKELPELVKRWI